VGTRAFNAPTAFSPNPSVTGSAIREQAPVPSFFFVALPTKRARTRQGAARWSERPVKTPSRRPKSAPCSARIFTAPDPRAGVLLPREESGDEGRRPNHSDAAATTTYKRATDKPVQDGAQEQDSGARVIIIKVPRLDGSRPHRYGGLEWDSAPHPYRPLLCHLCM